MSKLDSPYSTRKPVPEHSEDPEHSSSDDFTADGPVARVLLRPVLYFLFHHLRLFGWLPASAVAAAAFPKHTLGVAALYAALHRQRWWQQGLHAALGYGASYRSKVISPYKGEYDRDKKYLLCIHPHGMLVDGFHNFVAKNVMLCEGEAGGQCGTGHPTGVRGSAGCFAPVIQHIPVHSEMYRDVCSGSSAAEVSGWWDKRMPDGTGIDPVMAPGGFAECCFSNAGDVKKDYHYLKGRLGFIKVAIKNGADIAPLYGFNVTNMYADPLFGCLRGARARLSQKIMIGINWPVGKWGTFMPLTDATTNVWFPPFKASQYTLDRLEEAHADYLAHLKKYFDLNKAKYAVDPGIEIEFVGKDFVDDDSLTRMMETVGLRAKL